MSLMELAMARRVVMTWSPWVAGGIFLILVGLLLAAYFLGSGDRGDQHMPEAHRRVFDKLSAYHIG